MSQTKKYNVHLYAVVRVLFKDVEAKDQKEAMITAKDGVWNDLHGIFDQFAPHCPDSIGAVEFAEEIDGYLVDEVGDEDYNNSFFYDKEMKKIVYGNKKKKEKPFNSDKWTKENI